MQIPDYPRPAHPLDGTELFALWQDGQQIAAPGEVVKVLAAAGAAPAVDDAKSFAAAAASSAGTATAKAAQATQAAADAGGSYAGVQSAISGVPTTAQLPLQATSRAIMAGFTGQTAGRQAQLSEAGRSGLFEWRTGDQSANITADPYQALYVPPATQTNGTAGAWARIHHHGIGWASWAGVRADGITAWHLQLNSLLQHPELWYVGLDGGVTGFGKPLRKKSGMTFDGRGPGVSFLRAIGFTGYANTGGQGSLAVTTVAGAVGCRDSNFTLDMAKTGNLDGNTPGTQDQQQRVHGICPFAADDYVGENLQTINCTGYAFVAFGGKRGSFRRTHSINAQVHMEFTNGAAGWTSDDHVAEDGDGDIVSEAALHWLAGSKGCVVRNPNVTSSKVGNGAYLVNNDSTASPMRGNGVIGGSITLTGDRPGVSLQNQNQPAGTVSELHITGTVITTDGPGAASNAGNVYLKGVRIKSSALGVTGVGAGLMEANGCTIDAAVPISMQDPAFAFYLDGGRYISPDGQLYGITRNCFVAGQPIVRPAPDRMLGVGHRYTFKTTADMTNPGGYLRLLGFQTMNGATYRVTAMGRATGNRGMAFWLDGIGTGALSGSASLQTSSTGAGAPINAAIYNFADGLGQGNSIVFPTSAAQPNPLAFKIDAELIAGNDGFLYLNCAPTVDGQDTSGSLTVLAGTLLIVEMIA